MGLASQMRLFSGFCVLWESEHTKVWISSVKMRHFSCPGGQNNCQNFVIMEIVSILVRTTSGLALFHSPTVLCV